MKCKIKVCFILFTVLISISLMAVPTTINFQGALKDANGVPVNDTQFMEFRIYDNPYAGNLLWSEPNLSVEIIDGIFSVELGLLTQFSPYLFELEELYITFFYGGEEMTPMQKLHSVPYAFRADNSNLIEDVSLSGLVQQDLSGNATITGTMSAGSFVGDGSGITNIGSFDDLYVNATEPDTISVNSSEAALTLENSGFSGNGLDIDSASNGIRINSTSNDGIFIGSAGQDGIEISNAGDRGIEITSSSNDGVYINSVGSPSGISDNPYNNGFEVAGAEGNGLNVGIADLNGVRVYTAGNHGFNVNVAGANGLYVGQAYEDGVYVGHAYESGVYVENAEDWGVMVMSSGLDGVWVNETDMNGIYVLDSNWDGVHVGYAGLDGVDANTEQASHEWGFNTPDKINGSNITTRSQSTHVRYIGNDPLEAGDLICIAGGYEEDVLGEDDDLPVVNVKKVNSRNSEAVLGVVEYKVYIHEKVREHEDRTHKSRSFRFAEGSISNGDYLSVVVFGPADVNVGSNSNIKTGEKLTVADNGYTRSINDEDTWRIGILGKALEDSNGRGKIKVFVNCR